MDEVVFQDCYTRWVNSVGNQPFWNYLAEKYNYPSAESLRSSFKRERKQRGIEKVNDDVVQHKPNLPLIAVVDVETLPMIGYMWSLWDVNFGLEQIIEDSSLLSWAGRYLNNDTIFSDIMTPEEALDRNSYRISESLHNFISKAQIVIGHNFRAYDSKVINTAFLEHEMLPLRYRMIDTLEVAKANFRFASNKMAFINKKLGIREKLSNEGFALWSRCSNGDAEALEEMLRYNEQDILATENLFYKVQPYINNMPNFSVYSNSDTLACHCGSENISVLTDEYWFTNTAKYQKYRCNDCTSLIRGKTNLLSKEKRDGLLVRL